MSPRNSTSLPSRSIFLLSATDDNRGRKFLMYQLADGGSASTDAQATTAKLVTVPVIQILVVVVILLLVVTIITKTLLMMG